MLFEAHRAERCSHKALRDHVLHHLLAKPRTASVILLLFAQTFNHVLCRQDITFLNLMHPNRKDFQESHCFQGLLVALYALHDHLGLTILGDDQRLLIFPQFPYNFGGMGL
jgi:hypothetical protein